MIMERFKKAANIQRGAKYKGGLDKLPAEAEIFTSETFRYCVSQLPKPLSTIIQELYIRGKERKDIILELGLSESTFRRYRQKAIEDLAEMYLALQSAGVVLEWDD